MIIYGFPTPDSDKGFIAIDNIRLIQGSTSSTQCVSSSTLNKATPFYTEISEKEPYASTTALIALESTSFVPVKATEIDVFETTEYTEGLTALETISTSPETLATSAPNYKTCANKEIPPEMDFAPCTCTLYLDTDEPDIRCDLVNMTDLRDGIFKRLNYVYIRSLFLKLIDNDVLPSNFLGSAVKQINWFTFDCTNITNQLEVSPMAFESNNTIVFNHLNTIACDFSDLSFLSGEMNHVDDMTFQNSSNLHDVLAKIPNEFSMDALQIIECSNLALIDSQNKLPNLPDGIQILQLSNNEDLKDETLVLFLDWLRGNSRDKLSELYIQNNGLTQIPSRMFLFSKLAYFIFSGNKIKSGLFAKGSLEFSYPLTSLIMEDCGIQTMEKDAVICENT